MANTPLSHGEKDTRKSVRGTFDWREGEIQISDQKSLFSRAAEMVHKWKRESGRRVQAEQAVPMLASEQPAIAG